MYLGYRHRFRLLSRWQKTAAGFRIPEENEILFLHLRNGWRWRIRPVCRIRRSEQGNREKVLPLWWSRRRKDRKREFQVQRSRNRWLMSEREDLRRTSDGYLRSSVRLCLWLSGSFFLQCAFRRFPGVTAKHGIFTDQVKKISKRTVRLFLTDDGCGAFDIQRL